MATGLTGAPVHAGSWGGLPDFGVTEAIGGLFGRPLTSQGGSNLIGGQIQGAATGPGYNTTGPASSPNPTYSPVTRFAPAGTNGGAATTNKNVGAPSTGNNPGTQAPGPAGDPHPNLDPMFQPLMDNLEQQVGQSTQSEGTQEQGLAADLSGNISQTNNDLSGQMGQFGNQQNQLTTQTQNAKAQARQGAAEIQQGIQARYGGTTGTGAFASELGGRQANQTVGQLNQNAINGYQAIDTARNHAQLLHDSAIQDLTQKSQVAVSQAKDALANRIVQIRGDQASLQGQKASLTQQAIQHYQDTVNQVNQFNTSFQQNLAMEHQRAQDYIAAFAGKMGGLTPTLTPPPLDILHTPVGNAQGSYDTQGVQNNTQSSNGVQGQLDFNKFPQNGYSM